jgi:hypothetical protein
VGIRWVLVASTTHFLRDSDWHGGSAALRFAAMDFCIDAVFCLAR